jgi:hypothetical protein
LAVDALSAAKPAKTEAAAIEKQETPRDPARVDETVPAPGIPDPGMATDADGRILERPLSADGCQDQKSKGAHDDSVRRFRPAWISSSGGFL